MNIFEDLATKWHHNDQEAPVTTPAHASSGNLGLLVADAKDHLDQGIDWLRVLSAQHLPALEAIAANPVIQAVLAARAAPAVPVAQPAVQPEPHDAGTMAAEGPAPEQPAA